MRGLIAVGAFGVLWAAGFGCGLFDEFTTFTIATDPQSFRFDSKDLGISIPQGATIPAIPCSTLDVCSKASAQLSCGGAGYQCSVVCAGNQNCGISATAEQAVSVDISSKIKNNTQAAVLGKVTPKRLVLTVTENKLTFKTPSIQVFVGPATATKTTDPGVVPLATIPGVEAKQVPAPMDIPLDKQGQDALGSFVKNYTVPFKLLAKASFEFSSGAPVPQGSFGFQVVAHLEVEPLK